MYHLILLLPVLGLVVFWIWPLTISVPVYGVIFILSLGMYALIMRAMRRPVLSGSEELLHSRGEVVDVQGNVLHVRVHSELWNAASHEPLHRGDHVRVIGMEGLVLRVERVGDIAGPIPMREGRP